MNKTFDEAKEETYSLFSDRCRGLLDDFLREKDKTVCSLCSESCSDGKKIHKALRNLIEELTVEAAKRCDNKVDFLVCLLCPYLSSEAMLRLAGKGETVKSLVKEMEQSGDRLLALIRRNEGGSKLTSAKERGEDERKN